MERSEYIASVITDPLNTKNLRNELSAGELESIAETGISTQILYDIIRSTKSMFGESDRFFTVLWEIYNLLFKLELITIDVLIPVYHLVQMKKLSDDSNIIKYIVKSCKDCTLTIDVFTQPIELVDKVLIEYIVSHEIMARLYNKGLLLITNPDVKIRTLLFKYLPDKMVKDVDLSSNILYHIPEAPKPYAYPMFMHLPLKELIYLLLNRPDVIIRGQLVSQTVTLNDGSIVKCDKLTVRSVAGHRYCLEDLGAMLIKGQSIQDVLGRDTLYTEILCTEIVNKMYKFLSFSQTVLMISNMYNDLKNLNIKANRFIIDMLNLVVNMGESLVVLITTNRVTLDQLNMIPRYVGMSAIELLMFYEPDMVADLFKFLPSDQILDTDNVELLKLFVSEFFIDMLYKGLLTLDRMSMLNRDGIPLSYYIYTNRKSLRHIIKQAPGFIDRSHFENWPASISSTLWPHMASELIELKNLGFVNIKDISLAISNS